MNEFRFFARRELWVFAVVSVLAALSFLGSVLLAFADDGRTPWFRAEDPAAGLVADCAGHRVSSERHRCVRQLAAAAASQSSAALALVAK